MLQRFITKQEKYGANINSQLMQAAKKLKEKQFHPPERVKHHVKDMQRNHL
jgi:hypothetical protein